MLNIYLASPYSDELDHVREARFKLACQAAAQLIATGKTVFSPIAHSHSITSYGLPMNWEFWARQDLAFIECCEEMVVLQLPGWEKSVGVKAEMDRAKDLGMPITFLTPWG